MVVVMTERHSLAQDLWEYGEDELAERALELSDIALGRVSVRAGQLLLSDEHATPSGAGPTIAKACALAAVEVMEGTARPLKRRRRRVMRAIDAPPAPPPLTDRRKVRELFLEVCAAVAEEFVELGYRFAPSGPHMSRPCDGLRFGVSFDLQRQVVSPYAHVQSRDLRVWWKRSGTADDGYLATGQLGKLRANPSWLEWEFIEPEDRSAAVQGVTDAIRQIALPWFALFENEAQLAALLESGGVPGCEGLTAVQWLVAVNRRRSAELHGAALLAAAEWNQRAYEREQSRLAREGIETGPYFGVGEGLAYATAAYGLAFER